ncbi:hypothetical protein AVEN_103872-1, partial [Araneus ventricosus]
MMASMVRKHKNAERMVKNWGEVLMVAVRASFLPRKVETCNLCRGIARRLR